MGYGRGGEGRGYMHVWVEESREGGVLVVIRISGL